MEFIDLSPLLVISLVVAAGTVLQVATGIGLGLLAGPVLILSLQPDTAIFVAIILNLLLSLALLPAESTQISWPPFRLVAVGTLVGVPLGWLVLQQIDTVSLKLLAGVVVLAAGLQQLLWRRRSGTGAPAGEPAVRRRTLAGGALSGFMTASLAIPGPVAMWAILQHDIAPTKVRATLRATFVFSYSVAFLVHMGLGSGGSSDWGTVGKLLPALAVGLLLGMLAKRYISEAVLGGALRLLLLLMGLALLWKGISDVIA